MWYLYSNKVQFLDLVVRFILLFIHIIKLQGYILDARHIFSKYINFFSSILKQDDYYVDYKINKIILDQILMSLFLKGFFSHFFIFL